VAGIGRATALPFAGEGAKLSIADMPEDGGRPTVHLLKEKGGEAIFVKIEPLSHLRKMLLSPLILLTTAACAGTMERTWTKVPTLVFVPQRTTHEYRRHARRLISGIAPY
jgi:hypothetical protein